MKLDRNLGHQTGGTLTLTTSTGATLTFRSP